MSIQISVALDDISAADLLVGYSAGAIIRVQRDTTSAFSAPVEVTTIAIVSGTESYLYWDSGGTSASYYRTRYENAGGTILSAWSAAFQVGTSGYLCSLTDVKRHLNTPDTRDDELLLEFIAQVSADIHRRTGKLFTSDPVTTYTFDTHYRDFLLIPTGIRTLSTLGIASSNQPDSGGTYTTVTAADILLRPLAPERGWPYTRVVLNNGTFYEARNGATITGTFGWAAVPDEIEGVAIRAVVRAYQAKAAGYPDATGVTEMGRPVYSRLYSLDDKRVLDYYSQPTVV